MIVNLTPHDITLRLVTGEDRVIPSSGEARVDSTPGHRVVCGLEVPVFGPDVFGDIVGLPDPTEGTFFIVSAVVGSRVFGRPDVLVLGTGPKDGTIREPSALPDGTKNPKGGQIKAVTRLKMLG